MGHIRNYLGLYNIGYSNNQIRRKRRGKKCQRGPLTKCKRVGPTCKLCKKGVILCHAPFWVSPRL